tara:strand:- start:3297 stop:5186 length:1890 start_codon:yes stop_codon:yes gene_type:complete
MAYSTTNNTPQKDIKYLNKDFNTLRDQLIEYTQTYYPQTFNDFSEGSPGMMFLEMAAYVGDVLSYYTDTQLQETFLLLSQEKKNLFNLAYSLGYRPKVTKASSTLLEVFQLLPAKTDNNYTPDYDYALTMGEGSSFSSTQGGISFVTEQLIDFNISSSSDPTDISVYQIDGDGNPQYYLLKKNIKVISAVRKTTTFSVGTAEKFLKLNLNDNNIIGIEKVEDINGNIYTEVDYLAQDTIFSDQINSKANDSILYNDKQSSPYLMEIKRVPRRFTSRFTSNTNLELQFGAGTLSNNDETIIPNPTNIGLGISDGRNELDRAYDPSNFLFTGTYGKAPSNTTLTVTYLIGGGFSSNVASNTINKPETIFTVTKPNLNTNTRSFIIASIASNNPQAATGGGDAESIEEIRFNSMANFAAQKRTVTKDDYILRTLSMPSRFGNIAKAFITQDDQINPLNTEDNLRIPNPLALNLYTLGYDINKNLSTLSNTTKINLSTYLEQYRMLTDAINIKDAFVVNISINFKIRVSPGFNNQEVLLNCIQEVQKFFNIDKWQIGQPIIKSEIVNTIIGIIGVQSVQDIIYNNESGESLGYSKYKYDIQSATIDDVIFPSLDPCIFEIKYPNTDIKGQIIT